MKPKEKEPMMKKSLMDKKKPTVKLKPYQVFTFGEPEEKKETERSAAYREIFNFLDYDSTDEFVCLLILFLESGTISVDEIKRLTSTFRSSLPKNMEELILQEVDKNNDGEIDYDGKYHIIL